MSTPVKAGSSTRMDTRRRASARPVRLLPGGETVSCMSMALAGSDTVKVRHGVLFQPDSNRDKMDHSNILYNDHDAVPHPCPASRVGLCLQKVVRQTCFQWQTVLLHTQLSQQTHKILRTCTHTHACTHARTNTQARARCHRPTHLPMHVRRHAW